MSITDIRKVDKAKIEEQVEIDSLMRAMSKGIISKYYVCLQDNNLKAPTPFAVVFSTKNNAKQNRKRNGKHTTGSNTH